MDGFSCWTCPNKKCVYKGSWTSRASCRVCKQTPRGTPDPKPAGGARGSWANGPPARGAPKSSGSQLSEAMVAIYARMPENDFKATAELHSFSSKQIARVVSRRALDAGAPEPVARAARQDTDALQQRVQQAQQKFDKSQEATAKAMAYMAECKRNLTTLKLEAEAAAAKAAAAYSAMANQNQQISAAAAIAQMQPLLGALQQAAPEEAAQLQGI
eukprot:7946579-Pyramimonas_sp.AAC.1